MQIIDEEHAMKRRDKQRELHFESVAGQGGAIGRRALQQAILPTRRGIPRILERSLSG
jgi:hypothetical protein